MLIMQVIMAILNISNRKRHALRLNFVLSSRTSTVDMLQKYSRIFDPLDIKVNADITDPAKFKDGMLHINRDWVYEHHAYPNLLALLEIVQAEQGNFVSWVVKLQQILFIAELGLLYGLFVNEWFAVLALPVAMVVLGLGVYAEVKIGQHIDKTIDIATDLLDLDEFEVEWSQKLLAVYQNQAHTYPVDLVVSIYRFFKFW